MKPIKTILNLFVFILFIGTLPANADVKLPALIGNNMILQQNQKVKIWGWAEPGEKISIYPGWLTEEYSTEAGQNGKWLVEIKTLSAGGPFSLKIEGKNVILLENILFGEVWICSGQSNMEFTIKMLGGWDNDIYQSDKEDFENCDYSAIRLFDVARDTSYIPLDNCSGTWEIPTLEKLENFSAVAWFFGRELYKKLKVPVGLISSNWGGTPAEAWTNPEAIERNADLAFYTSKEVVERKPPRAPGVLYNAMIHPLLNCRIKGVIWYQGESNRNDASHYQKLFPAMIRNWREEFRQGGFPFYFVQIAPYNYREPMVGALVREAQLIALCTPNTGMAVTMDIGDVNNIHPKNKQDVGKRLALIAFSKTYGYSDQVYSGPAFKAMEITEIPDDPSITGIRIFFFHVYGGLKTVGEEKNNFLIAGPDKHFATANVIIEDKSVLVWSKEVSEPIAVRYAFTNTAQASLFNKAGLPASSFRTDNWPVITDEIIVE